MRSLFLVPAALPVTAAASAGAPERHVRDNVVLSTDDPQAAIRLPDDVTYVGTDRFLLTKPNLGPFDACELHAFARADKDGRLRQFYWVHFEHLLPRYPKMHYTYDSKRHTSIGGMDFFVDVDVSDGNTKPTPGSNGEHFYNLLEAHHYKRVPMVHVRLVHLPDATKRKELMIIVADRLPEGVTAASLKKGGSAYARWPAMKEDYIARAVRSISIFKVSSSAAATRGAGPFSHQR